MEDSLFKSKQEIASAIAGTIKSIKARYREIDHQLKESKIKHVTIDVNGLIKSECRKTQVPVKTVRAVAQWGKNITTIQVNEKEQE